MPDDLSNFAEKTMRDSKRLLALMEAEFDDPADAFYAGILAVSVIGHGAGFPVRDLCDGIEAAYSDLSRGGQNAH